MGSDTNTAVADVAAASADEAGLTLPIARVPSVIVSLAGEVGAGDCRRWAVRAGVPLFEPGDDDEASHMHRAALALVDELAWPVLLRLRSPLAGLPPLPFAEWHPPAVSPTLYEALARSLCEESERSPFNILERGAGTPQSRRTGFIACGAAAAKVRETSPDAPLLRLGMTYPLPLRKMRGLSEMCGEVFVCGDFAASIADELRAEGIVAHVISTSASCGRIDR